MLTNVQRVWCRVMYRVEMVVPMSVFTSEWPTGVWIAVQLYQVGAQQIKYVEVAM